jgi:hypothetical protein
MEVKSTIFWDIKPCSPLNVNGMACQAFVLVPCLAYWTLKMVVIYSSEMLVDFQWTKWHYIPEDSTLHNHRCENLKSYKMEGRKLYTKNADITELQKCNSTKIFLGGSLLSMLSQILSSLAAHEDFSAFTFMKFKILQGYNSLMNMMFSFFFNFDL